MNQWEFFFDMDQSPNFFVCQSCRIVGLRFHDLRKRVDHDLLEGVGYLMGSIPEDFKN